MNDASQAHAPPAHTNFPRLDTEGAAVRYSFACEDVSCDAFVLGFEASEELNRPYRVELDLGSRDESLDAAELLGHNARFTLERGDLVRHFHGVVSGVRIHDDGATAQTARVTLVPALATLGLGRTTRIFQEQTALQILETVLREGLTPQQRELDVAIVAHERYPVRDYCVQYQESDLDFCHRLMEEEGIGYYFESHERERVVLFDDNRQLAEVPTLDGGPVPFDYESRSVTRAEPIVRFMPEVRLRSEGLTVRDHDWTRGRPTLEASHEGAEPAPWRAVYDHGFHRGATITEDNELLAMLVGALEQALIPRFMPSALVTHSRELMGSPLTDFTKNDVGVQAQIRKELYQRDKRTAHGSGVVTGFSPGGCFSLLGHPTLGADGEYFLTRVRHTSNPERLEDGRGGTVGTDGGVQGAASYSNEFECLPLATLWRPARSTPKPRIYGVQTAKVVGPVGMDVYTDQHARVRVRFTWDRASDDPSGRQSCWLRVSQVWAGAGHPGFMFIPRLGMEVIVSFIDGDPDRPIITGCVHNGNNHPPDILPFRATKSVIRTRTIPHGPGYNELSFEDAMGMEEIYLKAQRNLREDVGCNHVTHVKNVQANQVEGDQIEQIGGNQRLYVKHNQDHIVHGGHTLYAESYRLNVLGTMNMRVGHSQTVTVESGSRSVRVEEGEHALFANGRFVISQGGQNHIVLHSNEDAEGSRGAHIKSPHAVEVMAGDTKITMNTGGSDAIRIESPVKIELVVGGSKIVITPDKIEINNKTFPA